MTFDWQAIGVDVSGLNGVEAKTTCPRCSATRKKARDKCLNVNLQEGIVHCWHCDWGDKAPDASRSNTQYVRSTVDKPHKVYAKPDLPPAGLTDGAMAWLESRGITRAVAERNKLTVTTIFMPQVGADVSAIAFPYFRCGEVVNIKYRSKEKHFRLATGAERLLYGYDDMRDTTLVVEGEMDKLACEVAGFQNCVSVPDGAPAPNSKNLESKFDFLNDERVSGVARWIIAVDNDAPGLRLQQELIRRFGSEKCAVVTWPDGCKDANDVLDIHGPRTLQECINGATEVPIVGVFGAREFADDFQRMYDGGVPKGLTTGWDFLDEHWRVQPGQLLIVTGIPGHGKSEFVDALCVNLALDHGWSTAFYSPENEPTWLHLMKLAEKYIGKPMNPGPNERMSCAERDKAMDWMSGRFHWIRPEQPNLEEIIDKARALVLRSGIRCLVIDPWNEIEHNRVSNATEAEYIGQSLTKLRKFARKHELLLIVVAHPRLIEKKVDGTYPVPTPYDISGGAMWRNKADNCITVHANPKDSDGAVEIHVQKVKFKLFGQVGMVPMRWDRLTGRYFGRPLKGRY